MKQKRGKQKNERKMNEIEEERTKIKIFRKNELKVMKEKLKKVQKKKEVSKQKLMKKEKGTKQTI